MNLRAIKSWPQFRPAWDAASVEFTKLPPNRIDAAANYLIGACEEELRVNGHVSRQRFVELLNKATGFGKRVVV